MANKEFAKGAPFLFPVKMDAYQMPAFKEVRNKEWVYFGEDNLYPEHLLKMFNGSAKNNAIITGKRDYIYGKGFTIDSDGISVAEAASLEAFYKNANYEESLNEVMSKASLDLEIFGGFALEILYKRAAPGIAQICHIDFTKIRSGLGNNRFYYSNDWSQTRQSLEKTGLKEYKPFNPNGTGKVQLLYYKDYRPNLDIYPLPDYIGCLPYVELDMEIANYHLSNIKNGFVSSYMLNFNNGIPADEEKVEVERQVNKKFSGTSNAGRLLINFSDSKENAPDVHPLPSTDADKQFLQLDGSVEQAIFTGHKITSPMLFGVKTAGQLGGRDEIVQASELFQNTYVTAKQQKLEKVFNRLAEVNGLRPRLVIARTEPLQWMLPAMILATAMTKDEIRENGGLKPMDIKGVSDILPPPAMISMPKEKLGKQYRQRPSDDVVLMAFKKYGTPASDYQVLKSKTVRFKSDAEADKAELEIYRLGFDKYLDPGDGTTLEEKILGLLKKNKTISATEIATALKEDEDAVNKAIKTLKKAGLLEISESGILSITGGGKDVIDTGKPLTIDFKLMYKYALDPQYSGPTLLPTSRKFCREMINDDMLFSRPEITAISAEVDYDVWLFNGGWYHDPETDENTPKCRHVWQQQVVKTIRK